MTSYGVSLSNALFGVVCSQLVAFGCMGVADALKCDLLTV